VPRSRKDIPSNGIWGWIGVGKRGAAIATLGSNLSRKLMSDGWTVQACLAHGFLGKAIQAGENISAAGFGETSVHGRMS
jgi:hypothetical protein